MRTKPLFLPIIVLLPLLGSACGSGSGDSDGTVSGDTGVQLDEAGATDESPEEPVSQSPTAEDLGAPTIVDLSDGRVTEFESQLRQVVSAELIDLNQILQAGEQFTDSQAACLGSFDPAIGESITNIDCGTARVALDNGVHPVYLHEAAFAPTTECNTGLLALNTDECRLVSAKVTAPIEWVVPEGGSLPLPSFAGIAEFNTTPGSLAIFSIVDAPNGQYDCVFDLDDGGVASGFTFSNCDGNLDSLTARLRLWLDRRANR